jgi:hypothetical protein
MLGQSKILGDIKSDIYVFVSQIQFCFCKMKGLRDTTCLPVSKTGQGGAMEMADGRQVLSER